MLWRCQYVRPIEARGSWLLSVQGSENETNTFYTWLPLRIDLRGSPSSPFLSLSCLFFFFSVFNSCLSSSSCFSKSSWHSSFASFSSSSLSFSFSPPQPHILHLLPAICNFFLCFEKLQFWRCTSDSFSAGKGSSQPNRWCNNIARRLFV